MREDDLEALSVAMRRNTARAERAESILGAKKGRVLKGRASIRPTVGDGAGETTVVGEGETSEVQQAIV